MTHSYGPALLALGILLTGCPKPAPPAVDTQALIALFEQIAAVPRCSHEEAQISQWLQDWGAQRGFAVRADAALNVCIAVPASPGRENEPVLVLQAHMDMVCAKTEDSTHEFCCDPIEVVRDGDWLTANGTTLGADDGIGVALALMMADSAAVSHPPLELLFTTNEEDGGTGAAAVTGDLVTGRTLVNIDYETEGVFCVGSAGLSNFDAHLPVAFEPAPEGAAVSRIHVSGLLGGHSGLDIGKHRANAVKLLAFALADAFDNVAFQLVSIEGGTATNAIAPEAEALVAHAAEDFDAIAASIAASETAFKAAYGDSEPDLAVDCAPAPVKAPVQAASPAQTQRVLQYLSVFPNGVHEMSTEFLGMPETSNNLGRVATESGRITCAAMQRSFIQAALENLTHQLEELTDLAGGEWTSTYSYPTWPPNLDSPLLAQCKRVYQQQFGVPPVVETVHAGLECALFVEEFPGLDTISVGPTIEHPHTPRERVHVPSITKMAQFLAALLADQA